MLAQVGDAFISYGKLAMPCVVTRCDPIDADALDTILVEVDGTPDVIITNNNRIKLEFAIDVGARQLCKY